MNFRTILKNEYDIDIPKKVKIKYDRSVPEKSVKVSKQEDKFNFKGDIERPQIISVIVLILLADHYYNLNNFPECQINMKFKNEFKRKQNKYVTNMLGPCEDFKHVEKAFIPYYVCLSKTYLKFPYENIQKSIDWLRNYCLNMRIQSDKAVWRGCVMSLERFNLLKLGDTHSDILDVLPTGYETRKLHIDHKYVKSKIKESNFMSFQDFSRYKYIIDCQSMHGPHKMSHSGRLFWEFHMNRVLFIPTDASSLWFQLQTPSPEPYVHYIPYKYSDMSTIVRDVKWLEENPAEYEKIRKNCFEFSKNHLMMDNVLKDVKNILNNV